jgi:hypothetical protein
MPRVVGFGNEMIDVSPVPMDDVNAPSATSFDAECLVGL